MATIFDEFSQEATAFINPSDCVRPCPDSRKSVSLPSRKTSLPNLSQIIMLR